MEERILWKRPSSRDVLAMGTQYWESERPSAHSTRKEKGQGRAREKLSKRSSLGIEARGRRRRNEAAPSDTGKRNEREQSALRFYTSRAWESGG